MTLHVLPTVLQAQLLEASSSSCLGRDSLNYVLSPSIEGCPLALGWLEWGKHGEDIGELSEWDKIPEGLGGRATEFEY